MGNNTTARPQMLAYLYQLPEHQIREPGGGVSRVIAEALSKKDSAVSQLLKTLEKNGLVWREKNARKTYAAGLTKQGIQVAAPETAPTEASSAPEPVTETEEQLRQTIAELRQRITELEVQLRNIKEARSRSVAKSRAQTPQKKASVVSLRITDLVRAGTEKDNENRELRAQVAELEKQSAANERRRAEKAEAQAAALQRRVVELEQAYANAMAEAATQGRDARTLRDELNRQQLLQPAA